MNGSARVHSIEALQDLRAALCEFGQSVSGALEEAGSEVQRVLMWLKLEQQQYWQGQIRRRTEACAQAKLTLKRKRDVEASPLGGQYSYVDERKAVAIAERQLAEAQAKYQNVQRWAAKLDEESFTFKMVLRGLLDTVELDLPNALADIDAMVIALEKYLSVAPPSEPALRGEQSVASMATSSEQVATPKRGDQAAPEQPTGSSQDNQTVSEQPAGPNQEEQTGKD